MKYKEGTVAYYIIQMYGKSLNMSNKSFTPESLGNYVRMRMKPLHRKPPDRSVLRILRLLYFEGKLNYEVTDKAKAIYCWR